MNKGLSFQRGTRKTEFRAMAKTLESEEQFLDQAVAEAQAQSPLCPSSADDEPEEGDGMDGNSKPWREQSDAEPPPPPPPPPPPCWSAKAKRGKRVAEETEKETGWGWRK